MKNINEIIKIIPKIELHVHLEGAIPPEAFWELLKKYDSIKEIGSLKNLIKKYEYKDFISFIRTWSWQNSFLREYDDFEFIAEHIAKDFIKQNIKYVESFYSPGLFSRKELDPQRITESIRNGFNKYKNKIDFRLICDFARDYGPDSANQLLVKLKEVKELGIIGIGIGGTEPDYPPEPFYKVFENARKYGFKTTAHAGEAAGPKSIWGAVKTLEVDRIGHGTRIFEDLDLVDFIENKQIPIELCPISNLRTGVIKYLKDHPIKKLYERNLLISINTDDPKMFNTSLEKEYLSLIEIFDLKITDVFNLIKSGIKSCWCSETEKATMITTFDKEFQKYI